MSYFTSIYVFRIPIRHYFQKKERFLLGKVLKGSFNEVSK